METPRILNMKIWQIAGKPVFCGYDEESSVYSLIDKCVVDKPSYIAMFQRKDIGPEDLSNVIMHNQVSGEDFECLSQQKMIPEELEILYRKIQSLKMEVETLKGALATPVFKSAEEQPNDLGTPSTTAIEAVIELVRGSLLGQGGSVYDQIKNASEGLSSTDLKLIELIGKHFGLSGS